MAMTIEAATGGLKRLNCLKHQAGKIAIVTGASR